MDKFDWRGNAAAGSTLVPCTCIERGREAADGVDMCCRARLWLSPSSSASDSKVLLSLVFVDRFVIPHRTLSEVRTVVMNIAGYRIISLQTCHKIKRSYALLGPSINKCACRRPTAQFIVGLLYFSPINVTLFYLSIVDLR